MPLINWKVELKLKWTIYCVLSAAGNDNVSHNNDDGKNIIITNKYTKLYVSVVTFSAIHCQIILVNDLKNQFIGINIKLKLRTKIQQMSRDICWSQILSESIDYLF